MPCNRSGSTVLSATLAGVATAAWISLVRLSMPICAFMPGLEDLASVLEIAARLCDRKGDRRLRAREWARCNPLDDITNVRRLQMVLKEGRVVSDKRHLSGAVL